MTRQKSTIWRTLVRIGWNLLTSLIPAIILALVVNVHIARAVSIDGPSMQPNLYRGYRVMIEKISYRFHPPQRGDVVVAQVWEGKTPLIKRVIAVAGETVEIRNGHTFINNHPLTEPWVTYYGGQSYPATKVPEGHIFIVGDNRAASQDSRAFGPIPIETIKGRAWLVYWPPEEIKWGP
jgi:signal peptidase I